MPSRRAARVRLKPVFTRAWARQRRSISSRVPPSSSPAALAGACWSGRRAGRRDGSRRRRRARARARGRCAARGRCPASRSARAAPRRRGRTRTVAARGERREEVAGQRAQVLGPLAERRQLDRHHVEPVVEVLAEAARRDRVLEVAVRGRDDAHVDAQRPAVPPTRWNSPSCSTRSSFAWSEPGQLADLVEEQRAAVRRLEAGPAASACAPVKAPLARGRRARPRAGSPGSAAQFTFTKRPRAALRERGGAPRRPPPCRCPTRRAAARSPGRARCGAACSTSVAHRPGSPRRCPSTATPASAAGLAVAAVRRRQQRADQRDQVVLHGERLGQVVDGAALQRLARGVDRGEGGHHHHLAARPDALRAPHQLEPVDPGHHEVREQHVEGAAQRSARRAASASESTPAAWPSSVERAPQRVAQAGLVVDDQDRARGAGPDHGRPA